MKSLTHISIYLHRLQNITIVKIDQHCFLYLLCEAISYKINTVIFYLSELLNVRHESRTPVYRICTQKKLKKNLRPAVVLGNGRALCKFIGKLLPWHTAQLSSGDAFVSEAGGLRFKSRDGQIGHSVANDSSPLRHLFKTSCVAQAQ